MTLNPLKPFEAHADQVRIAKEFKLREQEESAREEKEKSDAKDVIMSKKEKELSGKSEKKGET